MGLLSYVIAFFMAFLSLSVQAETISATSQAAGTVEIASTPLTTLQAACDAARSSIGYGKGSCTDFVKPDDNASCGWYSGGCYTQNATINYSCPSGYSLKAGDKTKCVNTAAVFTCPTGQNWTLSGASCTRPDCVAPQVRDPATGLCAAPPDPCASRTGSATGWYASAVGAPSLESAQYCDNGCTVGMNAAPTGTSYTNGKLRVQQYAKVQLSYSCTSGLASAPSTIDAATTPPEPPKKPPCAAAEGVLTSSSGTIACVPSGTPASAPPIVDKKKTVDSFPDGSTKTTESTTTRDPQTGVEDKQTTTTNTPATGGGVGQAGTPGTTTSATTGGTAPTAASGTGKEGDTSSDFCQKNPSLQICKGDMNKEETQVKVKEALETAFKTDGVNNDDITNAAASEAKKQQATDAYGQITDKLQNGSDATGKQNEYKSLFSDWWEPIPAGSCAPLTATIASRTWTLDPCPQVAKISALAGYALWIYLAFGVLALVTKKAE